MIRQGSAVDGSDREVRLRRGKDANIANPHNGILGILCPPPPQE